MMGIKDIEERDVTRQVTLDDIVPKNHIIRKIDRAIDLSFIRNKVKDL